MAPLNLRFAGGLLRQQERGDVDGVGCSVPPLVMQRGVVARALRGPFLQGADCESRSATQTLCVWADSSSQLAALST